MSRRVHSRCGSGWARWGIGVLAALLCTLPLAAQTGGQAPAAAASGGSGFDYRLQPERIAENTWVLRGRDEDFRASNGGNIVNTAFIVTRSGVVVIDVGPSRRYGEQMRAAIARITDKPVSHVLITHQHPDHVLGAQAFADVGIYALPVTIHEIRTQGSAYNDNLYRLLLDWMKGTEVVVPPHALNEHTLSVGEHRLRLLRLSGHTAGDLAILDEHTGVLFAGDLVFLGRTPTTPHASIARWRESLAALKALAWRVVVPGHGPVHHDARGIVQTDRYLAWLDGFLREHATQGRDMSELLSARVPDEWAALAVFRDEFQRSLAHLYPRYEAAALR